jgi:hypothetical protein
MQKAAVKKPKHTEESIEAKPYGKSVSSSFSDIGNDTLNTLWDTLLGGGKKDVSNQLFGSGFHDLKPGQEESLRKQEKMPVRSEAHMEYFRSVKNADIAPKKQQDATVERRVEEIRLEIRQLLKESKQLESTFKSIQIEQKIVNAGTYHENLFDVLRGLIKLARTKVQEGISWAGVARSKKQQKQYWNQFKKHGTTFGLSHERTVATQTG